MLREESDAGARIPDLCVTKEEHLPPSRSDSHAGALGVEWNLIDFDPAIVVGHLTLLRLPAVF